MHSIGMLPAQASNTDQGQAERMKSMNGDRAAGSRARELLAMLAALVVVAGVGAMMVACTQF